MLGHIPTPARAACLAVAGAILVLVPVNAGRPVGAQPSSPWETLRFCTERVSVAASGGEADADSYTPSLADDGDRVAFISVAGNLDAADTNGNPDAFVHQRSTGSTRRISFAVDRSQDGGVGAGDVFISGDGQLATFAGRASYDAPGGNLLCAASAGSVRLQECIFVADLGSGALAIVDVRPNGLRGNSFSRWGVLSAAGDLVAFWSHSDDLVPGDINGMADVFARDLPSGSTRRVSVASDGSAAMGASGDAAAAGADAVAVSRDGRYVAFVSRATNLVANDNNSSLDVFLHDRLTAATERVSLATGGAEGSADSVLGARQAISDDGRYVLFASRAANLVPGDTNGLLDVFLRDRIAATTERVSVAADDSEAAGDSGPLAAVAANGRFVAFNSAASNLVPDDTNGQNDIFVRDRLAGTTVRASVASDGTEASGENGSALWRGLSMTADGLTVAWSSVASNLVPDDSNGQRDVFVRAPCAIQPTPTPTSTDTPTASPTVTATSTATPTPRPTPTATPTPLASCICQVVRQRVPAVVVDDALANPERYYGWRYLLDPGKPPGPSNPRRECLTLRNPGQDYHPLWNGPLWRVGCP